MQWYTADLHIHSVLSPCGGLEMGPQDLMQRLIDLHINWLAITDHNTLANCPAYANVAQAMGLEFSWGVEVQTSEEIHLLVYFDDPEAAMCFDTELYAALPDIANDPDFFGDQVVIDEKGNILKLEPKALSNSVIWDLSQTVEVAKSYGGYCVPAHVDASVNSIISQLGFLPTEPEFELFGITAKLKLAQWLQQHPEFEGKAFLRASDAHYLSDLGMGATRLRLEKASIADLFKAVRGENRTEMIV